MAVAVHNAPLADVAVDERQLEQDLATPSFEIIADDRVRWAHHGVDAGVLHPSPSVAPPPAARATSVPSAPLLPAPAPMPSHAAAIAPLVETHSELGDVRSKPAKHMPHLRAGEATIE
ncbi:hypothetical protein CAUPRSCDRAFT_12965 [Caulochytrium protostelioides]|nr:hypothetical protein CAUPRSCDRAFT_12965 [Caulochytrium protostelioides]